MTKAEGGTAETDWSRGRVRRVGREEVAKRQVSYMSMMVERASLGGNLVAG